MSTFHLLEKAERLENLAEAFYQALASRFGGDTKALFLRLAGEEAQHAARVRLLAARYRQSSKLMSSPAIDTPALDQMLLEAEEALADAMAGAWDGNPEAAMAGAAELERRFCSVHAQALSKDAHPDLRAFFEALASQDQAHFALLKS